MTRLLDRIRLRWRLFALAFLALAALAACPQVIREPALASPPRGCTQGLTLCYGNGPWVCGPGGEWSQADRRCDRLASVCCLAPSPFGGVRHACVPAASCVVDGGAP